MEPLDPIFAEAFIHQSQHRVMGRRLRPFCLWHRFLLRAVRSPLLDPSRLVGPLDLDRATNVCMCRYRQVRLGTRHPLVLAWYFAAGGFERERAAFGDYIKDLAQTPTYKIVRTTPDRSAPELPRGRPPEEVSTVAAIARTFPRLSLAQAWELPVAEAEIMAAMAQEAAGVLIDFETEDDRRWFEEMERRDAQSEKEPPPWPPDQTC